MQEEVNEKTISLCIKGGKITGTDFESGFDKAAGRDGQEKAAAERERPM